jgi:uncharacterized membrane protein YccF (DUF307 family)
MPFLIIFVIAMIASGGNVMYSIIYGIIGGFLLGVAWIFLQFILRVASIGLPDTDHRRR